MCGSHDPLNQPSFTWLFSHQSPSTTSQQRPVSPFPSPPYPRSLLNSLAIRCSGPWIPKPTLTKVPVCQIQVCTCSHASSSPPGLLPPPLCIPCWVGLQIQMADGPCPRQVLESSPPQQLKTDNQLGAADSTLSTWNPVDYIHISLVDI